MYTLKAKILVVKPTQQVSEKFRKREFVVADNSSQFPQYILFQAKQDKCDMLNGFNAGDEVEIGFFLSGREWKDPKSGETKYFNSLDAFKINKVAAGGNSIPPPEAPMDIVSGDETDDLPF